MAQLIVRNLNEEVVHQLKMRAARNGRSAEAEHREILYEALMRSQPKNLSKLSCWKCQVSLMMPSWRECRTEVVRYRFELSTGH